MKNAAEKVLPQALDAEMAVLGAMIIEKEAVTKALVIISEEDFYGELHRQIFAAIKELYDKNRPIDILTLSDKLKKSPLFEQTGGAAYLTSLIDAVQTAANAEQYALIVKNKSVFRKLINAGTKIVEDSFNEKDDPEKIVDESQKILFDISISKDRGSFTLGRQIVDALQNKIAPLLDNHKDVTGLATGFTDLDKWTMGLQPAELIIVGARPSMGKTAFALNIAENISVVSKKAVAVFSLEMTKESLMMRMLSSMSAINAHKMRKGDISGEEWSMVLKRSEDISEAPLYIDDSSDITVTEIRSRARELAFRLQNQNKDKPLSLIIVDYLQYIRGGSRRPESRQLEVAEISRSLKSLAKDLNIPVLVLSQLSRDQAKREKGGSSLPMLSDLRDSGAIEQDADVVMFIHYDKQDKEDFIKGKDVEVQLLIEKQRNGPTGAVNLYFNRGCTRFYDWSPRQE